MTPRIETLLWLWLEIPATILDAAWWTVNFWRINEFGQLPGGRTLQGSLALWSMKRTMDRLHPGKP